MNISDVVNITNGELASSPKIKSVNSATVYPSKVEQGYLFFSSNQEDTTPSYKKKPHMTPTSNLQTTIKQHHHPKKKI